MLLPGGPARAGGTCIGQRVLSEPHLEEPVCVRLPTALSSAPQPNYPAQGCSAPPDGTDGAVTSSGRSLKCNL